jgi:hypothetical protein
MGKTSQEGPEATGMKIVPTVREDPPEAVVVATTAQDEGMVMISNRMAVIHDQATTIVLPIPAIMTATAHDLVLQKAETSQQRSAIRTKSPKTSNQTYDWGFLFLLNSPIGMKWVSLIF